MMTPESEFWGCENRKITDDMLRPVGMDETGQELFVDCLFGTVFIKDSEGNPLIYTTEQSHDNA